MDWNLDHNNRHLENYSGEETELIDWIKEGEHQKQDFKFRIDSSQKIAKTLSAFANSDGGRLLIGVKDNGKVTGVDPEEEFYMVEGAADLYVKPQLSFDARVYPFEDKRVLVIEVPSSPERPHFVKEKDGRRLAYVRQADENFMASGVLLRFMRDKSPQSKVKNMVAFGPSERKLFELLSQDPALSISKYARQAKIPLKKAEQRLAQFLKWGIIDWKATERGIRYRLRDNEL